MKVFESEFWIGAGANRFLAKKLRLPAANIETLREGLKYSAIDPAGKMPPPALMADFPLLVISREVKPNHNELQAQFEL